MFGDESPMPLEALWIKARNRGPAPLHARMWNIFLLPMTLSEKRLLREKRRASAFLLVTRVCG
jgi:hypothetical protein